MGVFVGLRLKEAHKETVEQTFQRKMNIRRPRRSSSLVGPLCGNAEGDPSNFNFDWRYLKYVGTRQQSLTRSTTTTKYFDGRLAHSDLIGMILRRR